MKLKRLTFLIIAQFLMMLFHCETAFATEHDHSGWKGLPNKIMATTLTANSYLTASSYVPMNQLAVPKESDVILCLNGYDVMSRSWQLKITVSGTLTLCSCRDSGDENIGYGLCTADIIVEEGATLNISDVTVAGTITCRGTINMESGTVRGRVELHGTSSRFSMNGGKITGGNGENGGGLSINGGSASIHGGEISGNSATKGGGIYVGSDENGNIGSLSIQATISAVNITNNSATFGGGIYATTPFDIYNVTISNNTASQDGGGVYAGSSVYTHLNSSSIINNTATRNGGGVYFETASQDNFIHENTNISNNSATAGGGIYAMESCKINGATISNNTASQNGGGIYSHKTITLDGGSVISGNTAAGKNNGFELYDSSAEMHSIYCYMQDGYVLNGGRYTINGGYFAENLEHLVGDNIAIVDISQWGTDFDPNYKEGYPFAAYNSRDGFIDIRNNIVYDGQPIEPNNDFAIAYLFPTTMKCYYTVKGEENFVEGLPTDAGEYTIKISALELDYPVYRYFSGTADLTIHPATPSYTLPTNIMVIAGMPLSDIPLPEGWSWKDGNIVPQTPGTESYAVIYDPGDPNYTSAETEITVTVVNASSETHHDDWLTLPADSKMAGGAETSPMRYYLTEDTKLDSDIVLTNGYAVLCLNGYKLTGTGTGSVITVQGGAHLTVCDCMEGSQAPEHRHNYYVADNGLWTFYEGELPADAPEGATTGTVQGGVITGGIGSPYGGAVYLSGTMSMESGVLAGNIARDNGGGVYVNDGGALILNGGSVTGNKAESYTGGGVYIRGNGTFTMNGGIIAANWGEGGNSLSNRGTVDMTGGYISGSIQAFSNTLYLSGGYFDNQPNEAWIADGHTVMQIDAQFGDSDYREGFPWAVYTFDETPLTVTTNGDITYDGKPAAQGEDFTLTGSDKLEFYYSYTVEGSEDKFIGLPVNVGTYSVNVVGFNDITKTCCSPTSFTLVINKAEWTGEKTVEGTIEAGVAGSVMLPATPEKAVFGTVDGDPEVKGLSIADNQLVYLGGNGIEVGKTYNVTIPVSSPNYLDYDITVTLTGIDSSGITQTAADGSFRVVGMRGWLRILDSEEEATVYNAAGTAVYQGRERTVYVPAGVYLVRIGAKVERVIVR